MARVWARITASDQDWGDLGLYYRWVPKFTKNLGKSLSFRFRKSCCEDKMEDRKNILYMPSWKNEGGNIVILIRMITGRYKYPHFT